jgi:hypothetical protein
MPKLQAKAISLDITATAANTTLAADAEIERLKAAFEAAEKDDSDLGDL